MTVLLSGDWHFTEDHVEAYRFDVVRSHVRSFVLKHGVKLLVCLGDLTTDKDEHRSELVNAVVELFDELRQLVPVIILQGNHDWKSSPDHAYFRFLGRLKNITWIDEPTPLKDMILVPHSRNYEKDWAQVIWERYAWGFFHQTFAGTQTNGITLSGIPLSYFPDNLRLVSGDVHVPQSIGKLTYAGAPYTTSFGDEYAPRMLLLKDNRLTSLAVDAPTKRLIHVKSISELKSVKIKPTDIVKLRIDVPFEESSTWLHTAERARDWAQKVGLQNYFVQPCVLAKKSSIIHIDGPHKSDADLVREYAVAKGLGEDVVRAGLRLL